MTERSRKRLIFAVLIVVALWGVFNFLDHKKKASSPNIPPQTVAPVASAQPSGTTVINPIEKITDSYLDSLRNQDWGKDPFYHNFALNPQIQRHQEIALRLMGISNGRQGSRVMINGKVLKVGDEIDGYIVSAIAADYVELNRDGKDLTLRLTKESS